MAPCLWLPFPPREIGNCLKSCEESWPLITGSHRQEEKARILTSPEPPEPKRVFFAFRLFFVSLWFLSLAFHSNVISGVSASSMLPSPRFSHLWAVSKAQCPAIPNQMRFSGEALTVIREEGLNLRLSTRKDGEIWFRDGGKPLSKQGGKKPFPHVVNYTFHSVSLSSPSSPRVQLPTEDALCGSISSSPAREGAPAQQDLGVGEPWHSLTSQGHFLPMA